MKQFLKSLAIFLLPILLIGAGFEILLRNIPNDYIFKKHYLDRNSRNIETLFLGSSHTYYGINPQYLKSPSFNAGHISQSLNYDLEILKKYDQRWDKLKCIVLPIDYFSLYATLEQSKEAWRVKNYNIYYGIRSNYNPVNYSELFSNEFRTNVSRLRSYYLNKKSNITCSSLGWGTEYNSKASKDLVRTGAKAAKRHSYESDQFLRENIAVLESILEFAKAHNIKVALFTSPAYKTYVQHLEKDQLNNTISAVAKVAASYPNAVYFNLLTDNSFNKQDFYDADHLNEIGAKKLTLKIDSLVLSHPDVVYHQTAHQGN